MYEESFSFVWFSKSKLWSFIFIELDVCERPLSQIRSHIGFSQLLATFFNYAKFYKNNFTIQGLGIEITENKK